MKISLYNTFSKAEAEWRNFEETCACHVFQRYDWLSRWYEYIGRNERFNPILVAIRNNDNEPLFFFPLAIRSTFNLRMLTWLGGELTDYQGPIIGKAGGAIAGREFADLWAKVIEKIERFDIVYFFNQPKSIFKLPNPFIEFSTRPNAVRYYGVITKGVPYYKNSLSKKLQQDTRRQVNRLMSLGLITFVVAENMSERERITQILLEQKQRKYRETGVKDIFLNEAYRRFYKDLSASAKEKRIVHISALYVGDNIAATHWGMTWRGKYYYLLPGYAPGKWQQFSPGRILLKYLVDWSENNGDHIFDFTVGSEVYKSQWANRKEHVYEYIKPFSWRGNLFVFLRQLSRTISGRKGSVES